MTDTADYCGIFDFYGLQAQAFKAALIDGESITIIKPGPVLQLQVIASEFLDTTRDQNIANGIEYSPAGERVAYWIYAKHPGAGVEPGFRPRPCGERGAYVRAASAGLSAPCQLACASAAQSLRVTYSPAPPSSAVELRRRAEHRGSDLFDRRDRQAVRR